MTPSADMPRSSAYADLAGNELVATATYTFDAAYELEGLVYAKERPLWRPTPIPTTATATSSR